LTPILKQPLALAIVEAWAEPAGTQLQMEWTVEGRRGRIGARVAPLPFYDPPHKRA
jgi:glycine cleavage system aminomethyltransferase T